MKVTIRAERTGQIGFLDRLQCSESCRWFSMAWLLMSMVLAFLRCNSERRLHFTLLPFADSNNKYFGVVFFEWPVSKLWETRPVVASRVAPKRSFNVPTITYN